MLSRLGVLLALALLCLAVAPGLAVAAPCVPPLCPTEEPTTPPPTQTATPSPTRTATAQPTVTRSRTASPSPRPSRTTSARPTPVQTAQVTTAPTTGAPFGSVSPVKDSPAADEGGNAMDKLIGLVVGGAVLLGVGGAFGLYLTREQEEEA